MKLAHYDFESVFNIEPDCVNVLVLESEQDFFKYCNELVLQVNGAEGNFCLSEKDTILNMSKSAYLVSDYFSFSLNDKKCVTKLFQELQKTTEYKFYKEYARLQEDFADLFQKVNSESEFPLEYEEVAFTDILKAFGVHLSEEGNFLEKLVGYICVLSSFLKIKCFFFINLKTMLTQVQLQKFYREMQLNGICIFLLENFVKPKTETEIVTIIDRDFCEILV